MPAGLFVSVFRVSHIPETQGFTLGFWDMGNKKTKIHKSTKHKFPMPQSLVKNIMHLVWSTKNREAFIMPPVETLLHAYLAQMCYERDCPAFKVGGYTDHVHILCNLSKIRTVSKLVEEIKSSSSKWIKTQGEAFENFFWQRGYGGFSVSPREMPTLENYIGNQHTHHQKQTYQEEFRGILHEYEVAYNELHVWD